MQVSDIINIQNGILYYIDKDEEKSIVLQESADVWYDRFQRIVEIPKEDFEMASGKTDNFMIIELTIFPGRTREQKRKAIETITS